MLKSILAVLALGVTAGLASAADYSEKGPTFDRFYWAFHGGAAFPGTTEDEVPAFGIGLEVSGETGYRVGGAVGFEINPYIAIEVDVAYQQTDSNQVRGVSGAVAGLGPFPTTGSASIVTTTANVLLGAPMDQWRPYIGGGVGAAYFTADNVDGSAGRFGIIDGSDTGLALQAIVGIDFALNERVSIGGRYSYLHVSGISIPSAAGDTNNITTSSQAAELVLTTAFSD